MMITYLWLLCLKPWCLFRIAKLKLPVVLSKVELFKYARQACAAALTGNHKNKTNNTIENNDAFIVIGKKTQAPDHTNK